MLKGSIPGRGDNDFPLPMVSRKVQDHNSILWAAAQAVAIGPAANATSDVRNVENVSSESIQVDSELDQAGTGLVTVHVLPSLDGNIYADMGEDTVVDSYDSNGVNLVSRPPIALACLDWHSYQVAIENADPQATLTARVHWGNPGY